MACPVSLSILPSSRAAGDGSSSSFTFTGLDERSHVHGATFLRQSNCFMHQLDATDNADLNLTIFETCLIKAGTSAAWDA